MLLTFRTGKRHRIQESSNSQKNLMKLASKFQHFLNTGRASKRDLKAIDIQLSQITSEHGDKALQLLDQLRENVPRAKGKDILDEVFHSWAKWLSDMDSKQNRGYAGVNLTRINSQIALLEAALDADTDLFRMLSAFNDNLVSWVRQASYEVPDSREISESAREIIEAYETKQRILSKISN